MERTDTPSTDKQRKLNLIAAATAELAEATIKRIGADDLQLMSITFDDLADYVEKADDADRDMKEITEMLGLRPNQTAVSNKKTEDLCWHHQHVGPCRFGEDCRNEHVGDAGALRHRHEDENGICRDFKEGKCERDRCKFGHDLTKVTAAAAQTNGQWTADEKMACKRYCKERMEHMTADTLQKVKDSKDGVDGYKARFGMPLRVDQKQWWTDNMPTRADTNTTQTAAASAAQLYYDDTESDEQLTAAELLSDTDEDEWMVTA